MPLNSFYRWMYFQSFIDMLHNKCSSDLTPILYNNVFLVEKPIFNHETDYFNKNVVKLHFYEEFKNKADVITVNFDATEDFDAFLTKRNSFLTKKAEVEKHVDKSSYVTEQFKLQQIKSTLTSFLLSEFNCILIDLKMWLTFYNKWYFYLEVGDSTMGPYYIQNRIVYYVDEKGDKKPSTYVKRQDLPDHGVLKGVYNKKKEFMSGSFIRNNKGEEVTQFEISQTDGILNADEFTLEREELFTLHVFKQSSDEITEGETSADKLPKSISVSLRNFVKTDQGDEDQLDEVEEEDFDDLISRENNDTISPSVDQNTNQENKFEPAEINAD